jgi:hypothetical protein
MEDIGATSFTVAEAIVELVANSIDARLEDIADPSIRVDIEVSPDEIVVRDDAAGMDLATLAEAVRLGVKMDDVRGKHRRRKGMFGLGMKTAAASLGRYWSVTTRAHDSRREFFVEFDLEQYSKRRGDRAFDWGIAIDERDPDVSGPLGDRPHGTVVTIRRLRERDPMAGPILDLLGNAYKPHIEQGDEIFVNGDQARPREYTFMDGSRTDFDLPAGPEGEYRITGWVALDSRTHNAGDYGFHLYRENQLVEMWNKDWFRAHLMNSRIVGEANLDFVQVNFNKKGFQTQTPEWKLACEVMKEYLKPVTRASQQANRNRSDPNRYARAVEGMNRAMDTSSTAVAVPTGDGIEPDEPISTTAPVQVGANSILLSDGTWHLSCVVEDFGSEQTPWGYLPDDETKELQAVLNSNSRLYQQVKDEQFLGMLAIADTVTRFLMDHQGLSATEAIEIRDRWLYVALGDQAK